MVRRLLLLLAVVLAAAGVSLGPGAASAFATCEESGVFWAMKDASGNFATATGAINEISLNDRPIDTCVGQARTGRSGQGHTSRLLLHGMPGYYVEVGYQEWWCGSVHCFIPFTEYTLGSNVGQFRFWDNAPCPLTVGTYDFWRIQLNGSQADTFVNCNDGTGRHFLNSLPTGGMTWGYAEGEGYRTGASNMQATHRSLQWRDTAGMWKYANGAACRRDDDSYWDGVLLYSSAFQLKATGSGARC